MKRKVDSVIMSKKIKLPGFYFQAYVSQNKDSKPLMFPDKARIVADADLVNFLWEMTLEAYQANHPTSLEANHRTSFDSWWNQILKRLKL